MRKEGKRRTERTEVPRRCAYLSPRKYILCLCVFSVFAKSLKHNEGLVDSTQIAAGAELGSNLRGN